MKVPIIYIFYHHDNTVRIARVARDEVDVEAAKFVEDLMVRSKQLAEVSSILQSDDVYDSSAQS